MPSEGLKQMPTRFTYESESLGNPVMGVQVHNVGDVQQALYMLRSTHLVQVTAEIGLAETKFSDRGNDKIVPDATDDSLRGRDDTLWQEPDTSALARVPALMPFEVATTDTSSLATCGLCSSFSVIEAGIKVVRGMVSISEQAPDTVDVKSMVCPECRKPPVMLGLAEATRNRLANEERWRRSRSQCSLSHLTPKMDVYHTHASGQRARSSNPHRPLCYTRLYDWHKYVGSKTAWPYGQVSVQADFIPTVVRFFAGCIGSTRHGPQGLRAIAGIAGAFTAFDSVVSEDEKDYEVEDRAVDEYLAALSDAQLPNREANVALCMAWLCRSVLGDLEHTASVDSGKAINFTRAEALALRSSDLIAELSWAMSTGWTKERLLQARDELLTVTWPLFEVLGLQVLHNDIVGYTADMAVSNKANVIHLMEGGGVSAGPLAELQDAHWRIAWLAESLGGTTGVAGEALRLANGNAGFSWIAQRYGLLSNAHAMQAADQWQVASWWRWVAGEVDTNTSSQQRALANWAQSCAWRVAPQQTDGDIREQVLAKLNELAGRVHAVEDVASLSAGTMANALLGDVWLGCLSRSTEMEQQKLDATIDLLRTQLHAACEHYKCRCIGHSCCATVAADGAILYATMDEALGYVAALPPQQRLRHSDYLLGSVCVIMEAAHDSPVRAALWLYDPNRCTMKLS
ncbi:hypothetical protein H634G_11288 [Metarhizium anisopliae BRIP 53293]|uniref:Uncharacterized protein n=1 Tax=Metarhizium anisopliae BRIP 53293 TaxID=1291518 RepID=A0A0D9NLH6_METAN|nr:hypothetical protein H634G_11288 [Metarhizium anisopliae BRIP 53293]KJK85321.1 hypothetical protein H633G_10837 [Metarhizium anisopliae BRIP 53284]